MHNYSSILDSSKSLVMESFLLLDPIELKLVIDIELDIVVIEDTVLILEWTNKFQFTNLFIIIFTRRYFCQFYFSYLLNYLATILFEKTLFTNPRF